MASKLAHHTMQCRNLLCEVSRINVCHVLRCWHGKNCRSRCVACAVQISGDLLLHSLHLLIANFEVIWYRLFTWPSSFWSLLREFGISESTDMNNLLLSSSVCYIRSFFSQGRQLENTVPFGHLRNSIDCYNSIATTAFKSSFSLV